MKAAISERYRQFYIQVLSNVAFSISLTLRVSAIPRQNGGNSYIRGLLSSKICKTNK
jgi:hypothetical protein